MENNYPPYQHPIIINIDSFYKIYLLEGYELLKTDKALKLSTMIFPHKQDQINFMHQYLGK